MKLDAWLRQDRSPADRLRLVERLGQALNAVHDRGGVLTALDPLHVEVGNDRELRCDLAPAASGMPDPRYLAPERREGGPPSAEADVYATGLIVWEALTGRTVADPPTSLEEAVPDLPQELASAVMACLERSPQWRPKDLAYLSQLAAAHQKVVRRDELAERTPPAPRAPAAAPRPAARPSARTVSPQQRESRSHLPLAAAAALVVLAAAGGYFWFQREGATGGPAPRSARPAPTATPLVAAPAAEPSSATPTPAAGRTPVPGPATPLPTPTPTPAAAAVTLPAAPAPTPTPLPTPTPTPTPTPAPPAGTAPAPPAGTAAPPPETAPAAPTEPVVLAAVSPHSVRRPGKVLLDLRGSGFRSDLRVRVLPMREPTRGIAVARQKWVSASLVTVLLDLDASVSPGAYAIALEDPAGGQTKPLQITVTK